MSLGLLVSSLPWWIAAPLIQIAVLIFGMALDETYVNRTTILTGAIAVHIHGFVAGDVGILVGLYGDFGLVIGAYGLYAYVIDGYVGNWFRVLAYFVYSPLAVFLVILMAGPTVFGIEPLVVPALAVAGYANVQFREYLRPRDPFYFGPESQEIFEAVVETEAAEGTPVETPAAGAPTAGTPGASAVDSSAGNSGTGAATAAATEGATTEPAATASNDARTAGETATASRDATTESFDEPEVTDDGAEFEHPGAEPAAAADSSERGILPKFMRRL